VTGVGIAEIVPVPLLAPVAGTAVTASGATPAF